jgi:hypothetical protein
VSRTLLPLSLEMQAVHVLARLQEARERVAHGWPSVALALAGSPTSTAQARLHEAEEARYGSALAQPWVQVLTDALVAVEEALALWGTTPDTLPPATPDMPPCALELRLHLAPARACAEKQLAWEDPGGLTRPQALCVLHLAVCLAQWRAQEQRHDAAAAKAQAEIEQGRRERAAVAARVIWAPEPKAPRPTSGPRSLRDLASVADAFDQWEDEP